MNVDMTADDGSRKTEASVCGEMGLCVTDNSREPYEGMVFDSEEAARAFYDEYAGRTGFITRVLSSRKSERDGSIISRGLGCRGISDSQKSGNGSQKRDRRKEGCTAMLLIKREKPGRWIVRKFLRDHNHSLLVSLPKRRPTFDEKDKRIQELTAELRIKKRLSAAYHEQLLTIMKDVESHNEHLSTKLQTVRDNLKKLDTTRVFFSLVNRCLVA
ncbi:hypothetical protein M9H77_30835 [Catharanthus roseus]|uniref:Uncharacterized protein n=1 Tax=Catharanthus roseus TaxID=4058 RepID=A0ACC0A2P0_CATRO|nr:hypothetical protein M9H77_30835 [Catharanthus roseus]